MSGLIYETSEFHQKTTGKEQYYSQDIIATPALYLENCCEAVCYANVMLAQQDAAAPADQS